MKRRVVIVLYLASILIAGLIAIERALRQPTQR